MPFFTIPDTHQTKTTITYPAITLGNDCQDRNCEITRLPTMYDIMVPSGWPFVFISREGRMVIGATNEFVRGFLKHQLFKEFIAKNVQGRVAKLKETLYKHTLNIKAFISCSIPPHLEHFLLAEDNAQATDLSGIVFRMQRAIGGLLIEHMRTDEGFHQIATY